MRPAASACGALLPATKMLFYYFNALFIRLVVKVVRALRVILGMVAVFSFIENTKENMILEEFVS